MTKIFLAYNQIVTLRINIIKLDRLFDKDTSDVELVLCLNKKITQSEFQIKREKIDPKTFRVYNKIFIHQFPINEYPELETPILGEFWTFQIYINGKCVLSKKKSGAILCERKRYVERRIADYLEEKLRYRVDFYSGPNQPDLILKDPLCNSDVQCEITERTTATEELTYEKYRMDVDKYEKYKRLNRFPRIRHLLILPCTAGISSAIIPHIHDFVSIITFNDFHNLLISLKRKEYGIVDHTGIRTIISNPGIQRAPKIYEQCTTPYKKQRVLVYNLNLTLYESETPIAGLDSPLLYIRDINPYEVIKIVETAKNYDHEYRSKTRFKEIILRPENLKNLNKDRGAASHETNVARIKKEWWLITPIQLGYLDENCKITEKGSFLIDLLIKLNNNKNEIDLIRRSMGYDFLNAPGIKEFLKLINRSLSDPAYRRANKTSVFYSVLAHKMVEKRLSSCEANALKDCQNLYRWMHKFGYSDGISLKYDRIKEDFLLEEIGN